MKMMRVSPHQISGLKDLINDLPSNLRMVEIGCFAGESARMFLDSGKIAEFHAVDPWNIYEDYDMQEVEGIFNKNTAGYNVIKHRSTISEALEYLPKVDFIYIDGDHDYDYVLRDIILSLSKIKPSGIIAGHNYTDCPGVKKAVDKIFGNPHKIYRDSSWLINYNNDIQINQAQPL